mmetsp:Transcript_23424/g.43117  ORF Transcript_23424/g.43117 Transcript_23424/m.43117 type:complete len:216 (+) Transcript_23424:2224-2871(+)
MSLCWGILAALHGMGCPHHAQAHEVRVGRVAEKASQHRGLAHEELWKHQRPAALGVQPLRRLTHPWSKHGILNFRSHWQLLGLLSSPAPRTFSSSTAPPRTPYVLEVLLLGPLSLLVRLLLKLHPLSLLHGSLQRHPGDLVWMSHQRVMCLTHSPCLPAPGAWSGISPPSAGPHCRPHGTTQQPLLPQCLPLHHSRGTPPVLALLHQSRRCGHRR